MKKFVKLEICCNMHTVLVKLFHEKSLLPVMKVFGNTVCMLC